MCIGPGVPHNQLNGRVYCARDYLAFATAHSCRHCGTVVDDAGETSGKAAPGQRPVCAKCLKSGKAARPAVRKLSKAAPAAGAQREPHADASSKQPATASTGSTCGQCGEALDGALVGFRGVWYHRGHLLCAGPCGKPLQDSVVDRHGKPYCKPCTLELFAKRCAGCKKPIEGKYVVFQGNTYHRKHFTCTQCHERLSGTVHALGERPYCAQHYQELVAKRQCFSCHKVAASAEEAITYSDGRIACRKCDSTAVWDSGELQACFLDVLAFFYDQGFRCMRTPLFQTISVRLASPEELDRQTRRQRTCGTTGRPLGLTIYARRVTTTPHSTKGVGNFTFDDADVGSDQRDAAPTHVNGVRTGKLHVGSDSSGKLVSRVHHVRDGVLTTKEHRVKGILVLKGLPRVRAASVIAHELCHAFIGLYRVPDRDPVLVEGLCELWAYEYVHVAWHHLHAVCSLWLRPV